MSPDHPDSRSCDLAAVAAAPSNQIARSVSISGKKLNCCNETHLVLRGGRGLDGGGAGRRGDGALQGGAGQTALLQPAAVVGDLEGTALVVVQPTSWRGRGGMGSEGGREGGVRLAPPLLVTKSVRKPKQFIKTPLTITTLTTAMNAGRAEPLSTWCGHVTTVVPSHLRPCLTRPHSISPQSSQKAGAL